MHGGKREGAGRKKTDGSKVMRIPLEYVEQVAKIIGVDVDTTPVRTTQIDEIMKRLRNIEMLLQPQVNRDVTIKRTRDTDDSPF